ncbi:unnamed protein product [Vicia faba]|uniref:Uncharacterized protein n=1 Tax=Vicia faba TaxID=3906 RepID=A0AAV0YYC9_VICFA|nr:unnamed protein product [Vicia faba]
MVKSGGGLSPNSCNSSKKKTTKNTTTPVKLPFNIITNLPSVYPSIPLHLPYTIRRIEDEEVNREAEAERLKDYLGLILEAYNRITPLLLTNPQRTTLLPYVLIRPEHILVAPTELVVAIIVVTHYNSLPSSKLKVDRTEKEKMKGLFCCWFKARGRAEEVWFRLRKRWRN